MSVSSPPTPTQRKWTEKRTRGFFGWIFLLLFWGWNIFMGWSIITGTAKFAEQSPALTGADQQAYMAGASIGIMMWIVFWAGGSVVFGLLAYMTRGKRVMIETA